MKIEQRGHHLTTWTNGSYRVTVSNQFPSLFVVETLVRPSTVSGVRSRAGHWRKLRGKAERRVLGAFLFSGKRGPHLLSPTEPGPARPFQGDKPMTVSIEILELHDHCAEGIHVQSVDTGWCACCGASLSTASVLISVCCEITGS